MSFDALLKSLKDRHAEGGASAVQVRRAIDGAAEEGLLPVDLAANAVGGAAQ